MGNTLLLAQESKAKTVILRPDSDLAANFYRFGDDANWKCVDDIPDACDEDGTYV